MKLYTTKEAADFLGISIRTFRYWVKSGKIVPEKKGDTGRGKSAMFSVDRLKKVQSPCEKEEVKRQYLPKATVPCDKLSDHMFHYTPSEYKEILLDGGGCSCIEGKDRKGNEVATKYWLKLLEGYADLSPLTPFDKEVLFCAISAYEQGVRCITIRAVACTLTGSERTSEAVKFLRLIKRSVQKLMQTAITVDFTPLLKAFPKYRRNHKGSLRLTSAILPCSFLEGETDLEEVFSVKILDESPLMKVAKTKNQIMTYDLTPLAIPNQNALERVVVIKNYLLRRIEQIKQGRLKNNSVLFDTIYKNCDLENAEKWQLQDARKIVFDTLNHFKSEGTIRDFETEIVSGEYRSVKIIL